MNIRFGILGLGSIAPKFADALAQCEGASLYAVAARDGTKAEAFAQEYGAKVAYGSYEELVKDPNVDAVYVAVIHPYHVSLSALAMEHGKAVLCEKPIAVDLASLEELVALSREKNVLLMEALWSRFLPKYNLAKQWVAEGKIGTPTLFEADFTYHIPFDASRQVFDPARAGGAIYGVGCYVISAALDFCGGQYPKVVTGAARVGSTGVDEVGAAALVFENGILANLTYGSQAKKERSACMYGTGGKIKIKHFFDCHKIMRYNLDDELVETSIAAPDNGFIYEVQHFCELYRNGKKESDVISLQDSLDIMHVMEVLRAQFLAQ